MEDRSRDYSDIIDLPHHVSNRHPRMSRADRAAQFGSFDPLKDYKSVLAEERRVTEERPELSDEDQEKLNQTVRKLADLTCGRGDVSQKPAGEFSGPSAHPKISLTCFVPDSRKSGGSIEETSGHVRTVNEELRYLVFEDGRKFSYRDILAIGIEGENPD